MSLLKSRFIEMFKNSETLRLDQIAEVTMGQSPDSSSYNSVGKGIPFYQGKTEFTDKYIGQPSTWCTSPTRIAKENDILMSVRAPVGNVNIATEECCIGRGLSSIRPQNGFNSEFIFEALEQKKEELENKATGSTFKAINKDIVLSIQIPNTSISIQKEYSNFVKQIDKSKFLLQQILEKLELLKKSRFIEMFGQCNKEELIGNVVSICRGASPRPISEYITKDSEGINWIKIGDVSDDSLYITSAEEKITKEGASKSRLVHKGDFILSNSMSFGRPYILGIDGCVHDGWLILSKFSETFNEIFLYYALKSDYVQNQFRMKVNGATVKNLNSDLVKNTKIKVPPIEKQMEFSNFIEQIDKSKLIIQKALEDLVGKV